MSYGDGGNSTPHPRPFVPLQRNPVGPPLRHQPGKIVSAPLDLWQQNYTASDSYTSVNQSQAGHAAAANGRLQTWWSGGPASKIGAQFRPKLRGDAGLKSHGYPTNWDRLKISPAYVNMARQQQRQSMRTRTTKYRSNASTYIPAVFVPTSTTNLAGGGR